MFRLADTRLFDELSNNATLSVMNRGKGFYGFSNKLENEVIELDEAVVGYEATNDEGLLSTVDASIRKIEKDANKFALEAGYDKNFVGPRTAFMKPISPIEEYTTDDDSVMTVPVSLTKDDVDQDTGSLVGGDILSDAATGFCGKPVYLNHSYEGLLNGRVYEILGHMRDDTQRLGTLEDVVYSDGFVKGNARLKVSDLERISPEVLHKLRTGKRMDVSIEFDKFYRENESGEKEIAYLTPTGLAFLPRGIGCHSLKEGVGTLNSRAVVKNSINLDQNDVESLTKATHDYADILRAIRRVSMEVPLGDEDTYLQSYVEALKVIDGRKQSLFELVRNLLDADNDISENGWTPTIGQPAVRDVGYLYGVLDTLIKPVIAKLIVKSIECELDPSKTDEDRRKFNIPIYLLKSALDKSFELDRTLYKVFRDVNARGNEGEQATLQNHIDEYHDRKYMLGRAIEYAKKAEQSKDPRDAQAVVNLIDYAVAPLKSGIIQHKIHKRQARDRRLLAEESVNSQVASPYESILGKVRGFLSKLGSGFRGTPQPSV